VPSDVCGAQSSDTNLAVVRQAQRALRRTEYDPGAVLTGSRQDLGRHLGLGKLYRRSGQCDQAHGHIATAMTMYREIDMQFRLEKAEAEMGELT
jgi:lipopolysaccharide biosynthesis regulator YciM